MRSNRRKQAKEKAEKRSVSMSAEMWHLVDRFAIINGCSSRSHAISRMVYLAGGRSCN